MVKSTRAVRGRENYRGGLIKQAGLFHKGKHNKRPLSIKRKGQFLIAVLLLMGLVFAWPKLLFWLNQPIKRVEVHAPFRFLHKEQVESVLKPFLRQHFFQLDLKGLQEALLEEAWVKEVSFSKEWPDRLTVSLEEKEPVARWYERQLITGDGDIFSPSDVGYFSELPVLKGPQSQAQVVMFQYLAISQLLRPLGLSVSELELGRTGAWRFNIGDIQVYLGRDERMERLQRFVRLYHARLESEWHSVKRIDLRYSNGAAVAWRGRE